LSEPENGTSVSLYFPRSQRDYVQSHTGRSLQPISGGTETILVVEDDELVREHVRANLLGLGYEVVEAENGPEAMEILKQKRDIDLLFTDVVLSGGMNGQVLADAARALRPDLKVLFTSGYTEDTMVHHGRLDPKVELLSKPYRRIQLAEKLREVMG